MIKLFNSTDTSYVSNGNKKDGGYKKNDRPNRDI